MAKLLSPPIRPVPHVRAILVCPTVEKSVWFIAKHINLVSMCSVRCLNWGVLKIDVCMIVQCIKILIHNQHDVSVWERTVKSTESTSLILVVANPSMWMFDTLDECCDHHYKHNETGCKGTFTSGTESYWIKFQLLSGNWHSKAVWRKQRYWMQLVQLAFHRLNWETTVVRGVCNAMKANITYISNISLMTS